MSRCETRLYREAFILPFKRNKRYQVRRPRIMISRINIKDFCKKGKDYSRAFSKGLEPPRRSYRRIWLPGVSEFRDCPKYIPVPHRILDFLKVNIVSRINVAQILNFLTKFRINRHLYRNCLNFIISERKLKKKDSVYAL